MTDILPDCRRITCTLMLIGGPFQMTVHRDQYVTEEVSLCEAKRSLESEVFGIAIDAIYARMAHLHIVVDGDTVMREKRIIIHDGLVKCIYAMTPQAYRNAPLGTYPYTFVGVEQLPIYMQSGHYPVHDRRDWYRSPNYAPTEGAPTYQCEEIPLEPDLCRGGLADLSDMTERIINNQVAATLNGEWPTLTRSNYQEPLVLTTERLQEAVNAVRMLGPVDTPTSFMREYGFRPDMMIEPPRQPQPEVPTTYCFDCGHMIPIADTWTKKNDPNYALCEACFRHAESAGRAKEGKGGLYGQ